MEDLEKKMIPKHRTFLRIFKRTVGFLIFGLFCFSVGWAKIAQSDLELSIQKKVEKLLNQMTIEEKVGQMTQLTLGVITEKESEPPQLNKAKLEEALLKYHVGSILNVAFDKAHSLNDWHHILKEIQEVALTDRLKIPVLYGIDSIHGAHYTKGATIFPQSIAMAATWEPQYSQQAGEITALETRISGIPWNFFPVLDIGRQSLWPRFYETYGEDVYLAQRLGEANIWGQQGANSSNLSNPRKVAACMKHYVGYSYPWSGKDRTPAIITEKMMREYFLPTFESAVKAGAETVMINSGEVDGIPGHANYHLITEILKGEFGFKGFAVSDWIDIKFLHERDHYAATPEEAVKVAVMAGVDMSMVPFDFSFAEILVDLVKKKQVPMSRIDDAVGRILRVKFLLGLFENPFPSEDLKSEFGSLKSTELNLKITSETITLLKNKNHLLPLSSKSKILVTGPAANSLSALNGGWTLTWQGEKESIYPKDKKTIFKAIESEYGKTNVRFAKGVEFNKKASDFQLALSMAKKSDVVVLCLGEKSYTETPGNIDDLNLDSAQLEFAQKIYSLGKPVILIMVQGRPRIIREIESGASAILQAYLPGMEGGVAIAKILKGEFNPSGKLPFSYPRYANSLIPYDHKYQEESNGNVYNPQWPFGFGLSYTQFTYKNLSLNTHQFDSEKGLDISVQVTNSGKVLGKEVVQLYLSDLYRSTSNPPVKKLARFEKIQLSPNETREIKFHLDINDLKFIGPKGQKIVEPGEFKVQIEKLNDNFSL